MVIKRNIGRMHFLGKTQMEVSDKQETNNICSLIDILYNL